MKLQYKNIALLTSCLFAASCSNELLPDFVTGNDDSANKVEMTFTAEVEGNDLSTRTTVDDIERAYPNILWNSGDKINLFSGTVSNQFRLKSGAGTRSGKFTGSSPVASEYYALYPYNSSNTITAEGDIKSHIPAEQTVWEGTFNPQCGLMMAKTTDKAASLEFRHACGYIQYTADFDCDKVVFHYEPSNDNVTTTAYLAGDVMIEWNEGNPKATVIENENASNSITISCTGGLQAGKKYLVAACPVNSREHELIVDVYIGNVKYTRLGNAAQDALSDIRRAKINQVSFDLPNMNYCDDYEFVDLGLPSGTLWGTKPLGGISDFYAWGETEGHHMRNADDYEFSTHNNKWYEYSSTGGDELFGKYNYNSMHPEVIDNKLQLEYEDDAAHVALGGGWTMPTTAEVQELMDCCTWTSQEATAGSGIYTVTITGPNGNSIFTTASGYYRAMWISSTIQYHEYEKGTGLYVWTKDLCHPDEDSSLEHSLAQYIYFSNIAHSMYYNALDGTKKVQQNWRGDGLVIYPVHPGYTTYQVQ